MAILLNIVKFTEFSPVAQPGNLAMFGNNDFFAFLNSYWGRDAIFLGGNSPVPCFCFYSKSKMAAKMATA